MYDKEVFFRDDKDEIKYNPSCVECPYKCKQSFRSQIWSCQYTREQKLKKRKGK